MFFVPTFMPIASDAMTNASQPKTAVFQWLALQRPMRAAMLFERFMGDIWRLLLRGLRRDCFGGGARAGDELQAAAGRVRVRVVERVHGVRRVDVEIEV